MLPCSRLLLYVYARRAMSSVFAHANGFDAVFANCLCIARDHLHRQDGDRGGTDLHARQFHVWRIIHQRYFSSSGSISEGREDEKCGRVSACSAQTICEHADEAHTFDLPASMWHGILQFSDAACTHSRRTRISGTATGMWQTSCLSPSMTYPFST